MDDLSRKQRGPSGGQQILGSRRILFAILFGVAGFFGLPLLWMSPVFSRLEKSIWSIVVVIYSLILIGLTIAICMWAYHRIFAAT